MAVLDPSVRLSFLTLPAALRQAFLPHAADAGSLLQISHPSGVSTFVRLEGTANAFIQQNWFGRRSLSERKLTEFVTPGLAHLRNNSGNNPGTIETSVVAGAAHLSGTRPPSPSSPVQSILAAASDEDHHTDPLIRSGQRDLFRAAGLPVILGTKPGARTVDAVIDQLLQIGLASHDDDRVELTGPVWFKAPKTKSRAIRTMEELSQSLSLLRYDGKKLSEGVVEAYIEKAYVLSIQFLRQSTPQGVTFENVAFISQDRRRGYRPRYEAPEFMASWPSDQILSVARQAADLIEYEGPVTVKFLVDESTGAFYLLKAKEGHKFDPSSFENLDADDPAEPELSEADAQITAVDLHQPVTLTSSPPPPIPTAPPATKIDPPEGLEPWFQGSEDLRSALEAIALMSDPEQERFISSFAALTNSQQVVEDSKRYSKVYGQVVTFENEVSDLFESLKKDDSEEARRILRLIGWMRLRRAQKLAKDIGQALGRKFKASR